MVPPVTRSQGSAGLVPMQGNPDRPQQQEQQSRAASPGPLEPRASTPSATASRPRSPTPVVSAPHIEQLPLEIHGEIHDAILQSGTPYESFVATQAFMATSRTIRVKSNVFGGSGALETAVGNAFNDAATATAQDGMLEMFSHGDRFEHLSPSRRCASSYMSPPSSSFRLNIFAAFSRRDDGLALRVERDDVDVRPVARAA